MKRAALILATLALLLGGVGQARAGLIINGGFETGDFTGWAPGPNSFPEYIVTSPVNHGTYAAQTAGYSNNPDTLSQTVATTLGQTYDLGFSWDVTNGGPTNFFRVAWDGTTVFSTLNESAHGYQTTSVPVVGTGSDTLVFTVANDPAYTYLDDVTLDAAAVPEPATLTLLGIAVTGLAGYGWRRRKPAVPA